MAGSCSGCRQASKSARSWCSRGLRKCLRCEPLPPWSTSYREPGSHRIWINNRYVWPQHEIKQEPSEPGSEIAARLPETLSYALVAHKGNGGEVAQVDGVYMSSSLAAGAQANDSSFERYKSRLIGSQKALTNIKGKFVFRFMDLPEEIRRIILEMAMPDQATDATRWNCYMYAEPFVYRQLGGPEEDDYGLLSVTAITRNQRLRQETILVALEKGIVSIYDWHDNVVEWLARVDFGLLRQARMTSYQNGYDAIRRLHVYNNSALYCGGPLEIAKFRNLGELLVTDKSCINSSTIQHYADASSDITRFGEYWTTKKSDQVLPCVLAAKTLKYFTFQISGPPDLVNYAPYMDMVCPRAAEWLSNELKAGGSHVQVNVPNLLGLRLD